MGKYTKKLEKMALKKGLRVDELLKQEMLENIEPYENDPIHPKRLPKGHRRKGKK